MVEQLEYLYQKKLLVNTPTKRTFLVKIKELLSTSGRSNPAIICYLYIGSLYFLFHNNNYFQTIKSAKMIYLDGFLIGWAIRLFFDLKIDRIGVEDYLDDLFVFCQSQKLTVLLYGSTQKSNNKAVINIKRKYPQLSVKGINGYETNKLKITKEINNSKTDFLIIGLGLGKQEEWIEKNKTKLKGIRVILTVGNFVDILGGQKKLAPEILKRYYLRWVYRIIKEPRRLLKRYLLGLAYLFLITIYISIKKGIWLFKKSLLGD